jgi:hypothetical protein
MNEMLLMILLESMLFVILIPLSLQLVIPFTETWRG